LCWRLAPDRKVLQGLQAKLAPRARLVRAAPRVLKASKDLWVPRAQLESRDRLALRDHKDQWARRGRREMRVAKAQSGPLASADHQGRKAPLAHPAPPDQLARRVIPARHRQFASSRVRIALAAEPTKSWPVSCVQAARPTERSARPLERQQLVYAYAGERAIRAAYLAFVIFSPSGKRATFGPVARLAQDEERRRPGSEARSRGGLGKEAVAMIEAGQEAALTVIHATDKSN
jgi:hypothetical protein